MPRLLAWAQAHAAHPKHPLIPIALQCNLQKDFEQVLGACDCRRRYVKTLVSVSAYGQGAHCGPSGPAAGSKRQCIKAMGNCAKGWDRGRRCSYRTKAMLFSANCSQLAANGLAARGSQNRHSPKPARHRPTQPTKENGPKGPSFHPTRAICQRLTRTWHALAAAGEAEHRPLTHAR